MSKILPKAPSAYSERDMQEILSRLEQRITDLEGAFANNWRISQPVTLNRAFDPATATLADVANCLATLLNDLRKVGKL